MSDPYQPPAAPLSTERHRKRLPLAWNPIAWLVAITVMMTIGNTWLTYADVDSPGYATHMWPFVFGLLLAWWAHADRRARGMGMPFEFEAFVVFLWPIALPYYMFRTRGWWGLPLGLGSWLLYTLPSIVPAVVFLAAGD